MNLKETQHLILNHVTPAEKESVDLKQALGRICHRDISSPVHVPSFRQSARDGFAISSADLESARENGRIHLKISGEIAAGCTQIPEFKSGETLRIMTGAVVPSEADHVAPFEYCREKGDNVLITESYFKPGADKRESVKWIRPVGADLKQGQTIVKAGETVSPEHLSLLAAARLDRVDVFQRPRIGFLCTGSELIDISTPPEKGRVTSGNRFLLHALIRSAGAVPVDLGIAGDTIPDLISALEPHLHGVVDMLVTTGGTGPGKYDLVANALERLGVGILCNSMDIRPGKATRFGILGKTLIFSLPGPPPPVRILFHELIHPAVQKACGRKRPLPKAVRVLLSGNIRLKNKGILNLKAGVMEVKNGAITVRIAKRVEPANSIILIPQNRRCLKNGEKVTIHLIKQASIPLDEIFDEST